MQWRSCRMAALFMLYVVGLLCMPAGTSADFMAQGPYSPDGLRIPHSIELLSDTTYYPAQDTPADQPEGWFSPQVVKVIETYGAWSIGASDWKIETMYGHRWIRPKPWEIDIAPPERIMLLKNTPLYNEASEKKGPVAALTPQEVKVAGAEKQWFYTNDPSSKAWIRIRTTWMGDLWAHIPVKADEDSKQSTIRYTKGDYSFVLHDGKSTADIYWKGTFEKTADLSSSPNHQEGEWYLEQPDVRQLFGLSPIPWYEGHALYEGAYTVDSGKLPGKIKEGTAKLHAFLYDNQIQWTQKNRKDSLQPRLPIEENNDLGGDELTSSIEISPAGTSVADDFVAQLYRLSASRPLAAGPHDLNIVLRVGERIVWKQPWHVVME